ncbi:hypothetical protein [Nodularia chucula]|uniref:hypothetical protein n=1 Tax=Nodularia chucula TaxID=3093667 RepID=UPI0039C60686
MKNKEKESTNLQTLNSHTNPLFQAVNLEQQESVMGGFLSLPIFRPSPDMTIPGARQGAAAVAAAAATFAGLQFFFSPPVEDPVAPPDPEPDPMDPIDPPNTEMV